MNTPRRLTQVFAMLAAVALSAPLGAQDLDETWTVTVSGRSVTVNPDGSFFIPNVPVLDQFGPEGPGSAPDSLSDSFLRLTGTSTVNGVTRQAFSEPFQIRLGETFLIGDLTFEGPPLLSSLRVSADRSVLAVGASVQLAVTGFVVDRGATDLTPRATWTTYLSSNPRRATVRPDGLVTARERGRVFIRAENGGVTAVMGIEVASGILRVRIAGLVRVPDGTAAAGAHIGFSGSGFETTARLDGSFDLAAEASLGAAFSLVVSFESGGQRFSKTVELEAVGGLELIDLGTILLVPEAPPPADIFLQRVFDSGGRPFAMAAADLDGDGDPDIVALNDSPNLGVLRNQGDATFADRVQYRGAGYVALGDLDGDGAADAAVRVSSGLQVLRNLGDGTFAAHGQYASSAVSIAMGDVDQDGDSDLTVAFGDLFVLPNQGDGTLAAPVRYATVGDARSVALGDVDVDGDADLVAAVVVNAGGFNSTNVSVLRNQGDGTYATRVPYAVGFNQLYTAILSDLDGDDVPDVATVNTDTSFKDFVGILLNQGDGTFAPVVQYPAGISAVSITAGDLDGDGVADLAVANSNSFFAEVSVLINRGDGTLAPRVPYFPGASPAAVLLDDFDGDGDRDAAVANNANVQVLRNQGDGTLASHYIQYDAGQPSTSVALGDLDGDGNADLALSNSGFPGITVLRNVGVGAFGAPVQHQGGRAPLSVVWADLDGDGDADLAAADFSPELNSVSVLRNQGDGAFEAHVQYGAGRQPIYLVAGDLDGDGDVDLVAANPLSSSISVLSNHGDATFAGSVAYNVGGEVGGGQPHHLALGDLDGDGHADLAVVGSHDFFSQFYGHIGILRNSGDGTFTPHSRLEAGEDLRAVALGDLDGDGDADLAVSHNNVSSVFVSGVVSVLRNQGGGTFAAPVEYSVATEPLAIALEDFDRDGAVDISVLNGPFAAVSFLRNLGGGTFAAPLMYGVAGTALSFALADLDGDGDPDVAVTRNNPAQVSVLLNQAVK